MAGMEYRQDGVAASASFGKAEPRVKSSPRFWDRTAERYARTPVPDEAIYQRKLEITREYLRPDMNVMEFGCGTGSTALAHAPYVRQIHAIDFSAKMIEIARRKAEAGGVGNVTFGQSGIEEFDAPDASFDAILGLSVIHLLEDRKAAIAKVHRLLKPGGVFISSTACIADMMAFFKYIAPAGRALGLLPFVDIFTKADLLADLGRAGFAIKQEWHPGRKQAVFIVARKAG
jgi:2-polyprenyl-3-methyl-5-hydroxy-6-metoxy-1,4-benzoquinol methylase